MDKKILYEVIRIIEGVPLFLEEHIKRMENSFIIISCPIPNEIYNMGRDIEALVKKENRKFGNIKVTYNIESKELKLFFIEHNYPTAEMYSVGVKTILYFAERESPNAKIMNENFRAKINKEIQKNNAYEAILVDGKGFITEGSRSNIFMVKENVIITSPVKSVLPGVTREVIIRLIKENGYHFIEKEYNYKNIKHLNGMFISGTSPKILPINCVDNMKIKAQNAIVEELKNRYNMEIESYVKNNKFLS